MKQPQVIMRYRNRRVSWNSQQNLWWFRILVDGKREWRVANSLRQAKAEIDADLAKDTN